MDKKKGMTLIEVVVSITLLAAIAAGMLPAFPNTLRMLVGTREMTENIFAAQEAMEQEIEDVKGKIKQNSKGASISIDGSGTYMIFDGTDQRTVTGYLRDISVNDTSFLSNSGSKKIYTVVADTYRVDYPIATINSVTTTIEGIGSGYTGCYADTSSMFLSTHVDLSDPSGVNLTNIYRLYVSEKGFYISPEASPEEAEKGTAYPVFPDDYAIIPGEATSMLSGDLSGYAGKFLMCTVTPASRSGKMGETVPGNAIYLSGLKAADNLKLHLDCSMLDQMDSDALINSGNITYIKKLRSLNSSVLYAKPSNASYSPQYLQAQLINKNDSSDYTYIRYMSLSGNESLVTNQTVNIGNMGGFTTFIVVRDISGNANKIIRGGDVWSIALDNNGYLCFSIGDNTLSTGYTATDSGWHIIRATYKSNTLSLSYDGGSPVTTTATPYNLSFNNYITIGSRITGDIGEALVYSSISDGDVSEVEKYLKDKYSID